MALLRRIGPPSAILLLAVALTHDAQANERHFTFTYESAVLPSGARELEVWTTWRTGRRRFYSAFDHRFEYEVGLTPRLQTSLYLNASSVTEESALGKRSSRFEYRGVSSEWKYKLLDPVADPVGVALYAELAASTDTAAVETKVIVDKRVGPWLFAANLVVEPEWRFDKKTSREIELEADLAASYFLRANVAAGFEVVSRTELGGKQLGIEQSALYAGPVIAFAQDGWWVALTGLRQLPALARDRTASTFLLTADEYYDVRLLFSFHL